MDLVEDKTDRFLIPNQMNYEQFLCDDISKVCDFLEGNVIWEKFGSSRLRTSTTPLYFNFDATIGSYDASR